MYFLSVCLEHSLWTSKNEFYCTGKPAFLIVYMTITTLNLNLESSYHASFALRPQICDPETKAVLHMATPLGLWFSSAFVLLLLNEHHTPCCFCLCYFFTWNHSGRSRFVSPFWWSTYSITVQRVMGIQQKTMNREHETHQSLINSELMTVMDCRNCREIGETDCPELRIHSPSSFEGQRFCSYIGNQSDLHQAPKVYFIYLLF